MGTSRDALVGRFAVAIAALCAALVAATACVLAFPSLGERLGIGPHPAYAAGGQLDGPAALYSGSPYTLVLFARSTCSACQRGKPFYARLTAEASASGLTFVLASASNASRDAELAYAQSVGLPEGRVVSVTFASLRLRVVPTLVLADRRGRILDSWEGLLSSVQQSALLQRLAKLSHTP